MTNRILSIISKIEREISDGPCPEAIRDFEVTEDLGDGRYRVHLYPRDRRRAGVAICDEWPAIQKEIRRMSRRARIRTWQLVTAA